VLLWWAALCAMQAPQQSARRVPPIPPVQPIPFSHKTHAGTLDLECKLCHANPDPGEMMRIASPSVCMQCHASVKSSSPAVQKLAEAARDRREVRWARVYAIPPYVFFSHRSHAESGNTCVQCHGPVAERDELYREGDITMGGCMNCHREKKASLDCSYCHEPR
jgi:hypothetical protein